MSTIAEIIQDAKAAWDNSNATTEQLMQINDMLDRKRSER